MSKYGQTSEIIDRRLPHATFTAAGRSPLARLGRALVALSIFLLTLPNVIWLIRDHTVWPWDQAHYGQVALDLFESQKAGPVAWAHAMLRAPGAEPPLLTWLGQAFVPMRVVFGRVEPALLLLNVLCAMATLAFIYAAGRRIGASMFASLAGTLLCGGASLFIGMTNQFFVEALQMTCVAFMLFLATYFDKLSRVRLCALFVLATAISFLTKASAFTFALPILVYLTVVFLISKSKFTRRPSVGLVDIVFVVLALVVTGAAIGWYATNWEAMRQHFIDATSNKVALLYGHKASILEKLTYWIPALALGLSPSPWLLVLVASVTLLALIVATFLTAVQSSMVGWPRKTKDLNLLFGGLLFGLIALNIYGLSTIANEDRRFLATLIPCIGLLTTWALSTLNRRMITLFVAIAASANALTGIAYSLTLNPLTIAPIGYLAPYQIDDSSQRRLDLAVKVSCDRTRLQIVGVEYATLSSNAAGFSAAKQELKGGHRCYYTSLGYAETDVARAMAWLKTVDPDYFITIVPNLQMPPDAFNRVSLPVALALLHDPRFRRVPTMDSALLILARDRSVK